MLHSFSVDELSFAVGYLRPGSFSKACGGGACADGPSGLRGYGHGFRSAGYGCAGHG